MYEYVVVKLGLSDDAFWNMTPNYVFFLMEKTSRREYNERREAANLIARAMRDGYVYAMEHEVPPEEYEEDNGFYAV
jgi:hypothetical protein